MSPQIKLYNTLSRRLEPFEPMTAHQVKLYVCGPTVYDEAHLGHARCYITWDILYRFLTFMGYEVTYTRNITDVDDKILNRAAENGESPQSLAERYTQRFHDVMADLNVLSPTHEPKATDYVPQMVAFIQSLLDKGFAYTTPSGTVYYDTPKKADYGNLCHQNLDDLQSGARVEVDPEKRNPLDFALWKPAPLSEPCVWDAPWGPGRPGWHIECSTMSYSLLGQQLDIHAGGMDLIFPHHQNEIAQSEAFTGKSPFVKVWMHNGFVNVSGEKMSKSLGNFSTIAKLLESYDANTIRYFIVTHHYRSPVDFSDFALDGARNRVGKITRNVKELVEQIGFPAADLALAAKAHIVSLLNQPRESMTDWETTSLAWVSSMADDLNTAQALACLNELLSQANPKPNEPPIHLSVLEPTALGCFLMLSEAMGFDFITPQVDMQLDRLLPQLKALFSQAQQILEAETPQGQLLPDAGDMQKISAPKLVEEILKVRAQLRECKNWAASDLIRDKLAEMGIYLKDRKDGPALWHYEPAKSVTPS